MIPGPDKTITIVSQQESRDSNIFGRIPEEWEHRAWGQTVWAVFPDSLQEHRLLAALFLLLIVL